LAETAVTDVVKSAEQDGVSLEVNFALVLSRMVDSLQDNPAELRAAVYELARVKLREQVCQEADAERLLGALENAIDGVEKFSRDSAPSLQRALLPGYPADTGRADVDSGAISDALQSQDQYQQGMRHQRGALPLPASPGKLTARLGVSGASGRTAPIALRPAVRLFAVVGVLAAVILVGIYASRMGWPTRHSKPVPATASAAKSPVVERAMPGPERVPPSKPPLDFPIPTMFGVYAVSDGQLFELKPLAGKVPDARVAMSAPIPVPSETELPQGSVKFIVFRRDASSAPDRADVRLVAKVRSALAVNASGQAMMAKAPDSWVIRSMAIPFKAGPVDDHPELYLLQPETPDFACTPGRYVLPIKGQAFDFQIVGPVTDPRQCLERVDAVNGAFYSPCPENGNTRR
jgi:hypothetical protein